MGLPASRRRNVKRTPSGKVRRLPDVPGLSLERPLWAEGAVVAGVDEVGRGAWAGPVTVGAVVLPSDRRMYKLRDSKLLDPARREELADRLAGFALATGIGHACNEEIDRIGMSDAMRLAARRALDALEVRPDVVLLDGNWDFLAGYGTRNERVVHGDARSASIAAASIVAKVTRDRSMVAVAEEHPRYGFASNKGYPSPLHRRALAAHGPCGLHRHSWAPIAALSQLRLFGDDRGGPADNGEGAWSEADAVGAWLDGEGQGAWPDVDAAWSDGAGRWPDEHGEGASGDEEADGDRSEADRGLG